MMFLFIYDHVDRFDSGRQGANGTLNFTAFMMGKLRTWPQDAARTAYGRAIVSDRVAVSRAAESIAINEMRSSTETDRANALGTSVTDLRRREAAIATLSSLRNHQSLAVRSHGSDDMDTVEVSSDVDGCAATGVATAPMAAINATIARLIECSDGLMLKSRVGIVHSELLLRPCGREERRQANAALTPGCAAFLLPRP